MKTIASFITAVALVAPLSVSAQIIATNANWTTGYFNTNDAYDNLASLDGAPTNAPVSEQWKTTDPYTTGPNGSTSVMDFIPAISFGDPSAGNQTVAFGGYNLPGVMPGITNPVLYRDFTPFTGPAATNISTVWTVDFDIANYNNLGFTNKDSFGFNLQDLVGNSLAQFLFNPFAATENDLRFEWYKNGSLQTTNNFEIAYNALYRLTATLYDDSTFDLAMQGLVTQTNGSGYVTNYSVVTNVNLLTDAGLSSGYNRHQFSRTALEWDLASGDTNNPGSQALLVNSMTVYDVYTVIPEAKTWVAGILLATIAGIVVWRRRVPPTSQG